MDKLLPNSLDLNLKCIRSKLIKKHLDSKTKLEHKKAKGVPKKTLKRALDFENYRKTLEENENKKIKFNSIRSYNHQLFSIESNKQGLSNYDNKQYYLSNDESYPHGHYRLNQ